MACNVWTIFYRDTSKFFSLTVFEGPDWMKSKQQIFRLVWTQRGASLITTHIIDCVPQPFPLKATDHCYGASGRLLMGLGCKLIGHRKAQNIQWCSAFIPSWTGPCCRAKRWLISTLKLAWTVVSTVRRVRGVVKGPWDNILSTLTPFYQTSFLELLQNAKDLYRECLRCNTQIQVNDSNQKIQSLYLFLSH